MDPKILVPVVVAVVIIIVVAALFAAKRKSVQLKERFGPEYDRLVQQNGGAAHVENVSGQKREASGEVFHPSLVPG